MCCNVLQCVAVCCSELWCVAVCCSVLQCDAVCCSVMPCDAVCCSDVKKKSAQHFRVYVVLQCDVVWCSVLRCVAATFSRLQTHCISWLNKKNLRNISESMLYCRMPVCESERGRENVTKKQNIRIEKEMRLNSAVSLLWHFSVCLWKEPWSFQKKSLKIVGEKRRRKNLCQILFSFAWGEKSFPKKKGVFKFLCWKKLHLLRGKKSPRIECGKDVEKVESNNVSICEFFLENSLNISSLAYFLRMRKQYLIASPRETEQY